MAGMWGWGSQGVDGQQQHWPTPTSYQEQHPFVTAKNVSRHGQVPLVHGGGWGVGTKSGLVENHGPGEEDRRQEVCTGRARAPS